MINYILSGARNRLRKGLSYSADYLESLWVGRRQKAQFKHIENLALFVGYPRSGSSLIGALLDAHPNMFFAHELNALQYVKKGFSKSQLFYLLSQRSQQFALEGATWSGYSYSVPNQWNGRHRELRVIGDKKAGDTAALLMMFPTLLHKTADLAGVPLKLIHVVRNPFDIITTRSIKSGTDLNEAIDYILYRVESIQKIKESMPANAEMKDVFLSDFIDNPQAGLQELCDFLGVDVSPDFLRDAARIVFESPPKKPDQD